MALPHVVCVGGSLYFGRRMLGTLSALENEVFRGCNGVRSLGEVLRVSGADARVLARIAPFLIWWDRPVEPSLDSSRTVRRVVFSAAPEDAWLGMGGHILLEAQQIPTHLVNCFGVVHAGQQPEAFSSPEELSMTARDEAALAARMAGVSTETWAVPNDELRHRHFREFDGESAAFRHVVQALVRTTLRRVQPSEVFAPAAPNATSGASVLLFALLELVMSGEFEGRIHLYESAPSILGERYVDEFLARFENSYFTVSAGSFDITPAAARKPALLEVFRTRIDRASRDLWDQSAKRNARRAGGAAALAERCWTVGVGMEHGPQ